MLDLSDLEAEAEVLVDQLRAARCCDALTPCYRCSLLRYNVLARRRVVEIPGPTTRVVSGAVQGRLALVGVAGDVGRHAS